jgi:hypothetical protein
MQYEKSGIFSKLRDLDPQSVRDKVIVDLLFYLTFASNNCGYACLIIIDQWLKNFSGNWCPPF